MVCAPPCCCDVICVYVGEVGLGGSFLTSTCSNCNGMQHYFRHIGIRHMKACMNHEVCAVRVQDRDMSHQVVAASHERYRNLKHLCTPLPDYYSEIYSVLFFFFFVAVSAVFFFHLQLVLSVTHTPLSNVFNSRLLKMDTAAQNSNNIW